MTPREQILAKCKEVVARAYQLYNVDMSRVRVSFDLKGKAAGKAHGLKYRDPVMSNYIVKFNTDMLSREAFDHVLNSTVPHEYAHILCFIQPDLGKNHDAGWERICLALGGSGRTRHQEEVVYGKGITYEYTSDKGHTVRVGDRHHRKIQLGTTIRLRHNKGSIHAACAYSIVGARGQTLAAPIVKQPTMTVAPALPVQARVYVPAVAPRLLPPAPRCILPAPNVLPAAGESKASISRRIMLQGYRAGHGYETIIAAMIAANGYDRQLARGTFKANCAKVGIPLSFMG
jgi:predicted SprT family Zn-dependent metalloprotease